MYDSNGDSQPSVDLRDDQVTLTMCIRGPADVGVTTDIIAGHHYRSPSSLGRHHFHHSSTGRYLSLVYRRLLPQLSNPDPAWIYYRFKRRRRRPSADDTATTAAVRSVTTTVYPVTSPASTFCLDSFLLPVTCYFVELRVNLLRTVV